MTDREREKMISGLPPEFQDMFGRVEAEVTQINQERKGKSVWRRIGRVALWYFAIYGAVMQFAMACYLFDALMKRP